MAVPFEITLELDTAMPGQRGAVGYRVFGLSQRDSLREQIGEQAEAIVYAYGACDRAHARSHDSEFRDRFSGEYWVGSALMRRQLAELSVANELDLAEQGALAGEELTAVQAYIARAAPRLSQAAWSALCASRCLGDAVREAVAPSGDLELAYRELGVSGERVLLWHGGATPELTWSRQHGLSAGACLRIPWRRGFSPSVAIAAGQDWELDARDLLRVMPDRAHVLAHSYAGISALLAAGIAPERFSSLIVIEPPAWWVSVDDAEVQQLAALGRAFASGAPEARAAFLAIAGLPPGHAEAHRTEQRARGFRDPGEAMPDLARVRRARLPVAVASGAHNRALERVCDALAEALAAERWVLPGSGHAVQRVPEFNLRVSAWLARWRRAPELGAIPAAGSR